MTVTSNKAERAAARKALRRALVELSDSNALRDPFWDVVAAVDNERPIEEIRRLYRIAAFDQSSPLLLYRARKALREVEDLED